VPSGAGPRARQESGLKLARGIVSSEKLESRRSRGGNAERRTKVGETGKRWSFKSKADEQDQEKRGEKKRREEKIRRWLVLC
jgi:hypothetical protein